MIDRIQSRSAFARVRREGSHVRSGLLSCTMVIDPSLTAPQVGYALSRSYGSAVERNRLRRQLRELVKVRADRMPAGIYVFGGSPKAKKLSFAELGQHLDRLISKMAPKPVAAPAAPAVVSTTEIPGVSPLANPGFVESAQHTKVQGSMLRAIRWYQVSREGRPSPCRFWPSCSHYAYEAIDTHGSARGLWLAVRRIIRCRPFGPSGVDPVPAPKAHS